MEEAPKPIEYIQKSKSFTFYSDKKNKFTVKFEAKINSEMAIIATEENNHKKYCQNYSLNSLKSNKYFLSLDTIDEIFDEIINKISYKTPSLFEDSKNLTIVIETFHSKFKDITFYLQEKEKNINDKVDELYFLISQFNIKEKEQDEKIRKLEQKIIELERKNNELREDNNILLKKSEMNESIILRQNNDYTPRLKNWISPNRKISFSLLYRMSRDGDGIKIFHNLCDNKGPTVSLYLLNDGNIVGGYTPLSWDTSYGGKQDNETFVFNLNKNIKCEKKSDSSNSIFCHIEYSGFYGTLGYFESSSGSMKKLYFFNSDNIFRNGNKILDYSKTIVLEPKEVEVLNVLNMN